MNALFVTNGESGAHAIQSVLPDRESLPWNDVLHDGPVPGGLDLSTLSIVRSEFLEREFGALDGTRDHRAELQERDNRLLSAIAGRREIVLWFESDLYDQLQYAQVVFEVSRYPGSSALVVPWKGPLYAGHKQLADAYSGRRSIASEEEADAIEFWLAFTSVDPLRMDGFCRRDSDSGFLARAGRRLLEEYPGVEDGLSRTQRQALTVLSEGPASDGELFQRCGSMEEDPFLGDWSFFNAIRRLVNCPDPLISRAEVSGAPGFALTDAGLAATRGSDYLRTNPIDRWIGGVHLTGSPRWRWDTRETRIVAADY